MTDEEIAQIDVEAAKRIYDQHKYLRENTVTAKIDDWNIFDNLGVGQLFILTGMDYRNSTIILEIDRRPE